MKPGFRLMSLMFKVRDLVSPRAKVLAEAGIEPGQKVLDFGCGPGGYILPLAKLLGPGGRIYALDEEPRAIEAVRRLAANNGLANVETIQSSGDTGFAGASIDVALLYDVFHDLERPDEVLAELCRVLKPGGILSLSDHHMDDGEIRKRVEEAGLFAFRARGKKTFTFARD